MVERLYSKFQLPSNLRFKANMDNLSASGNYNIFQYTSLPKGVYLPYQLFSVHTPNRTIILRFLTWGGTRYPE